MKLTMSHVIAHRQILNRAKSRLRSLEKINPAPLAEIEAVKAEIAYHAQFAALSVGMVS